MYLQPAAWSEARNGLEHSTRNVFLVALTGRPWNSDKIRRILRRTPERESGTTAAGGGRKPAERPTKLRQGQWAELTERFQAGETITALAATFDVHRSTIHTHLDQLGIPRSPTLRKLSDDQVAEAVQLYCAGSSTATIGGHFGVDASTVATALKRVGERLRPRRGVVSR